MNSCESLPPIAPLSASIAIAAYQFFCQQRRDLFMGRTKHHLALSAILETEQHRTIALNACGTTINWRHFPELFWLNNRHYHFLSADAIHLLTHDMRDFLDDAIAQRQKAIDAGSQLTDKASTCQEFRVAALRVAWSLT